MGRISLQLTLLCAVFIGSAIGCNRSGGRGSVAAVAPPCVDASGVWEGEVMTIDSGNCPDHNGTRLVTIFVLQVGCDLTVTDAQGNSFTGTIDGDALAWSGNFSDSTGTTTVDTATATIIGDSLAGTTSYIWTDGIEVCSGTTSFNLVRPCTAPGAHFECNPSPLPIPDASSGCIINGHAACDGSTIFVPHSFTISNLSVQIDITHPFGGDLSATLISPTGTVEFLIVQGVQSTPPDIHTTLVTSNFAGECSVGVWTLQVCDWCSDGEVGILTQWCIDMR